MIVERDKKQLILGQKLSDLTFCALIHHRGDNIYIYLVVFFFKFWTHRHFSLKKGIYWSSKTNKLKCLRWSLCRTDEEHAFCFPLVFPSIKCGFERLNNWPISANSWLTWRHKIDYILNQNRRISIFAWENVKLFPKDVDVASFVLKGLTQLSIRFELR